MNRIQRIRHLAVTLTGLACAWLGLAAAAPAAFAQPPGGSVGASAGSSALTVTRTVVVGGMPGWQIALIAVGAALIAAALTVLAGRVLAVHRRPALSAA